MVYISLDYGFLMTFETKEYMYATYICSTKLHQSIKFTLYIVLFWASILN